MSKIIDIGTRQHLKEEQRRQSRTKAIRDAFTSARQQDAPEDNSPADKLKATRRLLKIYSRKPPSKA